MEDVIYPEEIKMAGWERFLRAYLKVQNGRGKSEDHDFWYIDFGKHKKVNWIESIKK